jgi:hypothetical protein
MMAGYVADLLVLIHLLWILFLLVGIVFVFKRSRIAYVHVCGLLFSACLNTMGWTCPLTALESGLRLAPDRPRQEVSFVSRYVSPLVYPDLSEDVLRAGELVFVGMNLAVYAIWFRGRPEKRR